MSRELIVLTPEKPEPDLPALVSAPLRAAGHYVFDAEDRLLLRVEEPILISIPGEVERLLGIGSPSPVWWTEIHAAAASPEARRLAERCAESLNGTVWTTS
jgi:hypothetical protein